MKVFGPDERSDFILRAKMFCRIDNSGPGEDMLVEMLLNSAAEYLDSAGVTRGDRDDTRTNMYDLLLFSLVLQAYDHRDMTMSSAVTENPAFRRMLNQLKLTEPPVSDSDTGESPVSEVGHAY